MSNTNTTRTFTKEEASVLTVALLVKRQTANDRERAVIDRILRDGWK